MSRTPSGCKPDDTDDTGHNIDACGRDGFLGFPIGSDLWARAFCPGPPVSLPPPTAEPDGPVTGDLAEAVAMFDQHGGDHGIAWPELAVRATVGLIEGAYRPDFLTMYPGRRSYYFVQAIPPTTGRALGGYATNPLHLLSKVIGIHEINLYINPNPIRAGHAAGLLRGGMRRLRGGDAVSADDVAVIRYLPLDIDPIPEDGGSRKGRNSSDVEHLACSRLLLNLLDNEPEIEVATAWGSSGNGVHAVIRVADLPHDEDTTAKVRAFHSMLIREYQDAGAKIDPDKWTPAKTIGLPGSIKCKGPDTSERPRRVVGLGCRHATIGVFDLDNWLGRHRIEIGEPTFLQSSATIAAPSSTPPRRPHNAVERARRWLAKREPAVEGRHGDEFTQKTIYALMWGWLLTDEEVSKLIQGWNARNDPPWSDKALTRKVREARSEGCPKAGFMLRAENPFPEFENDITL
jgi:hypothetical protein